MSAQVQKPMSEIRKELRIKWYRCPIDPNILRELSKPSDLQGFKMALGHLGLWLFTGSLSFYFVIEQFYKIRVITLHPLLEAPLLMPPLFFACLTQFHLCGQFLQVGLWSFY